MVCLLLPLYLLQQMTRSKGGSYVKDGLAESGLTSIVLPSVKTAREGVELIAKIVEDKKALQEIL